MRKHDWALLVLSIVLSGILMALGFNGGHQAYLALVILIPIFVAIRICLPWQGAMCGALWGLTLLAGGGQGTLISPITLLTLVCIPAAYVWVGSVLTARIGFNPFVLAVAWMFVEAAISPHVAPNHGGLIDRTWMSVFGSMIAPLLLGFCIALINAALLELAVCCHSTCNGLTQWAHSNRELFIASFDSFVLPLLSVVSAKHSRAPPLPGVFLLFTEKLVEVRVSENTNGSSP